ncbi:MULTISPECIES: NAD(P)/FAD-dependent oxidoreductase [Mesonia]|mgnify:CR=1 FL=1|uniref:NADH dehydrogenase-like protein n=1 Tax=Mesonia oceanica TaxID=2687242 RepID=A0AC61Y488_9FLAO|nr:MULTISPECIES: NAD(P)/FAD-dependent oxidoreductase [Mesonia]MAN28051.1 FAD-dependent oxidoreductase [Mesonia sp.]MAQ42418.1 FAD-dependent oxidoreductase [Mesonia sp.]MBJ96724.1 FAD-dependent oxidoreductase [Flavobacteriaceae bacterium]VVU99296.1 NADH dehydrogenase-like protein [Mesonia oceanica]|tara:strand:- start:8251 stop:9552 length:1302 start_codon:yes stop_codon:yes gene_type:complete
MNIPASNLPTVAIVGGGFAGMNVAKKLIKLQAFQVVLIDKRNYHTFQPLLYQVSTSSLEPDSIAYPLRKLITEKKNAFFRLAEVTSIDTEHTKIFSDIGELAYDYLILATGSKTNFFGNEAVENNAMCMKTIPHALNIRSLILENLEQATITKDKKTRERLLNFVIAGAGPTGVELSGAIAEVRNNIIPKDYPDIDISEMKIHLLEGLDRVLPPMSEKSSAKAERFLKDLGVQIHLNTMVQDYDGKLVKTNTDESFETETFIWSAGVTGAPVQGLKAEALVERANRYKVNVFNQIEGYENVFAIGDIALMQSEKYPKGHPMVAQPAIQQGKHLAKNLERILKNEKLEPFDYFDKGTMATIGRNKAVVDLKKSTFGGFFAWFIWMFVHLWFLVGFRNRIVTFFNWTYSYINFDRAARLIVRPFKLHKEKMEDLE